ncbi:MAG: 1,4-beta-xylanase [Porticoccaceae bacterium]|nr:1,4-beta-xylanase [Porticoccaceae bacterium]
MDRREFIYRSALTGALLSGTASGLRAEAIKKTGLAEVYKDSFKLGTAMSTKTLSGKNPSMLPLIAKEFNAITAENAMKWSAIHPGYDHWIWDLCDQFVKFGSENSMLMIGHTLVWHKQTPSSVFMNKGKLTSRKKLLKLLGNHISTVVDRYKNYVAVWDVVNEAFDEEIGWRKSSWYNVLGPDYLSQSFEIASEADPTAHLIYNDFKLENKKKQRFAIQQIRTLKKKGVRVDGIGLQCHVELNPNKPTIEQLEETIINFHKEGLQVHITELDVDVLPNAWGYRDQHINDLPERAGKLNPYKDGLPERVSTLLASRYEELFRLFIKHQDKIPRVSLWGTSDDETWRNYRPVVGRTNYPLLFDSRQQPKKAYFALHKLGTDS